MSRELECIDCPTKLRNLADLRNHQQFVHELLKILIFCPDCACTFFKHHSFTAHAKSKHKKIIPGNKKSRVKFEKRVSAAVWKSKVIDHLDLFGVNRCKWMKFMVLRFTGWRMKGSKIELHVMWDKPFNQQKHQTWEPLEVLLLDCPDAAKMYCLQKALNIPKKSEIKTERKPLRPNFKCDTTQVKPKNKKKTVLTKEKIEKKEKVEIKQLTQKLKKL